MAYVQESRQAVRGFHRGSPDVYPPIATVAYRPFHPRGQPSLPNLYRSQLLFEPPLRVDTQLAPPKPIRKMPKSTNLSINLSKEKGKPSGAVKSPPTSPRLSSPQSPPNMNGGSASASHGRPQSPITALPQPNPPHSPKVGDRAKSIFSTKAFSKSQSRLVPESSQQSADPMPPYQQPKDPGSTPDLGAAENASVSDPASPRPEINHRHNASIKSSSEPHFSPDHGAEQPRVAKRGERKHKFGQMLTRTKSISHRDQSPSTRGPISEDGSSNPLPQAGFNGLGLRTAPLEMKPQDKRFREMMSGKPRTRSAERSATDLAEGRDRSRNDSKERKAPVSAAAVARDSTGSGYFLQGIRNSKTRASDLGKVGRGFFGKLTRNSSSHDKEDEQSSADMNPDTYKPTIIRLNLIDQTRATRISKRLESSRDKTEFWLPALPWRCIDYLNLKGLEVEGLYRVSGSLREIKKWQMRFDREKDVDLIEEKDLYDVNIIASLLKDWLRNLPGEIFPLSTQHEIQKAAPDAGDHCPPELSAALSQLPPFNYYLLFAITCHLSLLTSCYEKTKMDFDNLCVCIQPSLNIDRFIFKILIKDWRNCWQGCYTEKAYLEYENQWLVDQSGPAPGTSHSQASTTVSAVPTVQQGVQTTHIPIVSAHNANAEDNRTVSSKGSSYVARSEFTTPDEEPANSAPRSDGTPPATATSEATKSDHRVRTPEHPNAPVLSPHKPASPIESI